LLDLGEVQDRVARGEFTQEAGLVIGGYLDNAAAGAQQRIIQE